MQGFPKPAQPIRRNMQSHAFRGGNVVGSGSPANMTRIAEGAETRNTAARRLFLRRAYVLEAGTGFPRQIQPPPKTRLPSGS